MSLLALGMMVAVAQSAQIEAAPTPPVGSSPFFQKSVREVAEFLEAGEFAQATQRAKSLPKYEFTIKIDTGKLSKINQVIAKNALDKAIANWKHELPELKITESDKPNVLITFVKELEQTAVGVPKTLVLFESPDPSEPTIEAVVSTIRTDLKLEIEAPVYENEISFVIGSYLGLERQPKPGSTMFRIDGVGGSMPKIDGLSLVLAKNNVQIADKLVAAAKNKKKLAANFPSFFIDQNQINFNTVVQGEPQQFQIQIVNRGKAPMQFSIRPDCSCFIINYDPVVAPESTTLVNIYMSTADFQGPQDKGLFIYTNDPEHPTTRVGVVGNITPAYRLITGEKSDTVMFGESGAKLTYYLFMPDSIEMKPLRASVSGLTGVTSISPWEGSLADPLWNEPAKPRKGYKIDVLLSPGTVQGRILAALLIQTDNKIFPLLGANFYVQRGIAVSPQTIYFGDVKGGIARAWATINGTGKDFKILEIKSSETYLTAKTEKLGVGEYKLSVELNAKPGTGTVIASLLIKTDDPDSPQIVVPVQGYVP
ncbi:MAG: DUF1573 domain-containing protein [Fimbriimonadaceae bacterium]|nr:MAG: DUF1573 domain-containing protein [Fimbriimonadaceae bacterium]